MRFATLCQVLVCLFICQINDIYAFGRIYTTANNKQYFIEAGQEYTWFDGLSRCLKMNMNLVTIETEAKSQEINSLVENTFGKPVKLWVGGVMTHFQDARQYIWIHTGLPFSYTYWNGENPDFYNNAEYCVQIGWGPNMEWNDKYCNSRLGFICEYAQNTAIHNQQLNGNGKELENKIEQLQQQLKDHVELKDQWQMATAKREFILQNELQQLKEQLKLQKKETEEYVLREGNLKNHLWELRNILQELKEKYQKKLNKSLQTELREKLLAAEAKNNQYDDNIYDDYGDIMY
ncbi:lectin subunit alpha-like [Calliphora vicina]|uniref:lectin subunit alpha-like n=1 Tax=Calliphora vicina TaxID=7373 RepID=UPI00325ABB84